MKGLIWFVAAVAAAFGFCTGAAAQGFSHELFEIRYDGSIWRAGNCGTSSCQGWDQIDNKPVSTAIAAGADQLYQLHLDGTIQRWQNTFCAGNTCPAWQTIDNNVATSSSSSVTIPAESGSIVARPAPATSAPAGWRSAASRAPRL